MKFGIKMKFKYLVSAVILLSLTQQSYAQQTANVIFEYGKDVALVCNLTGNLTFYAINTDNTTSVVSADDTKYTIVNSTLTIKSLKKADTEKTYYCKSETSANLTFVSSVKPYLYQSEYLTIPVIEGFNAIIDCYLLVGTPNITWKWTLNDLSTLITNDSSTVSNNTQSILTIKAVTTASRGNVFCTAINDYGSYSRNITLRVKSRLAPLWPFIGFVLEVGLLALILGANYFHAKKKEDLEKEKSN